MMTFFYTNEVSAQIKVLTLTRVYNYRPEKLNQMLTEWPHRRLLLVSIYQTQKEETQDKSRPYCLSLCNHADLLHRVYHVLHL